MSVEPPKYTRRGDVLRLTAAFTVAICLAILATNAWLLYEARGQEIVQVKTGNANLVAAVTQRLEASFLEVDHVLNTLTFELERTDSTDESMRQLQPLLVNLVSQMGQLKGLFIYDKSGRWLVNSEAAQAATLNNSDREYFRFHRSNQSARTRLGPPVRSRSSGEWIIPMSRRINDPDGNFGGVVLGTLSLADLQQTLANFQVGKSGAIAVSLETKQATQILTRWPFREGDIGLVPPRTSLHDHFLSAKAGEVFARSPLDGIQRLISFDHTANFPVLVTVALSQDEMLADWRRSSAIQTAWALMVCGVIGFAGTYLVRSIRDRVHAEASLRVARDQLALANERLSQLAQYDGLTGLANRRYFDRRLDQALQHAHRSGNEVSVFMIDVDHFKLYNDTYGHLQGDECLRAVAAAISNSVNRPQDLAARFGGEEFVVLLPETDTRGALNVAESARAAVFSLAIPHAFPELERVTVSVGLATIAPNQQFEAASLLRRADEALYAAKRSGRNRVCSSSLG